MTFTAAVVSNFKVTESLCRLPAEDYASSLLESSKVPTRGESTSPSRKSGPLSDLQALQGSRASSPALRSRTSSVFEKGQASAKNQTVREASVEHRKNRGVDRFGPVVSDPARFEPAKLVGRRVFANTVGPSIEFRLSEVELAIDIERVKQKQSAAPAHSGSISSGPKTSVEAKASSETGQSAHDALVNLRKLRTEATTLPPGNAKDSPVRELTRLCEKSVLDAVTIDTLKSLSAGVEIDHADGKLQVRQFSLENKLEPFMHKDQPSTVFVLNGNNDEGYVRALGERIKDLKHVNIVVSGYGGHGTTDRFAVRTDKTEADRFAEILVEVGVKGKIHVEPFSTNSGENAQYVGELLATRMPDKPSNIVVCGTPAAALRQMLTYVQQMPRKRTDAIAFSSGPRIPLPGYNTAADALLTLRECFTLFNYLHNTAYLPGADSFSDSGKYTDMLKAIGVAPLAAIRTFRDAVVSAAAASNHELATRKIFSDDDGRFSLHEVMSGLSFLDAPGAAQRLCAPGQLAVHEKQVLTRAHAALGSMFQETEAAITRSPR